MIFYPVSMVYSRELSKNYVTFYGRLENGQRHSMKLETENPYFYVPDENGMDGLSIDGFHPLKKISTKGGPSEVISLRARYDRTYESKIQYVDRIRYDMGLKSCIDTDTLQPVDADIPLRRLCIDIETKYFGKRGRITDYRDDIISYCAKDNYTGRSIIAIATAVNPMEVIDKIGHTNFRLFCYKDERELLLSLKALLDGYNAPDIITGWNIDRFDLRCLEHRGSKYGIYFGFDRFVSFDLYPRYVMLRETDLESYELDHVAFVELGERKVEHKMSIGDMFLKDPASLCYYNYKDTDLTDRIDDKLSITLFYKSIAAEAGCSIESTKMPTFMGLAMYVHELRDTNVKLPTESSETYSELRGGYTMTAKEGLYRNVIVIDFSQEYGNVIRSWNISLDTLDDNGEIITPAGFRYTNKRPGILPKIIQKLAQKRAELRKLIIEESDPIKQHSLDYRQRALKELTNAMFGIHAKKGQPLYNKKIADSITSVARAHLHFLAKKVEDLHQGYEILYGDTDSVFLTNKKYDNMTNEEIVRDGMDLASALTKSFSEFSSEYNAMDCLLSVKFEKLYSKWAQFGAKKRYVYQCAYDDKYGYQDNKFGLMGFQAKRSDNSDYIKVAQPTFFKLLFDDPEKAYEWYEQESIRWTNKEIPPLMFGIYTAMRKDISEYKTDRQAVKAIRNSAAMGLDIETSLSKFKLYFIKGMGPMAYDFDDKPPSKNIIDWEATKERCFTKPFDDLIDVLRNKILVTDKIENWIS